MLHRYSCWQGRVAIWRKTASRRHLQDWPQKILRRKTQFGAAKRKDGEASSHHACGRACSRIEVPVLASSTYAEARLRSAAFLSSADASAQSAPGACESNWMHSRSQMVKIRVSHKSGTLLTPRRRYSANFIRWLFQKWSIWTTTFATFRELNCMATCFLMFRKQDHWHGCCDCGLLNNSIDRISQELFLQSPTATGCRR